MRFFIKISCVLLFLSCSRFEKVDDALLKHNITRTAFYISDKIYFSTLESYHTNFFKKDNFLLVKHDIKTKQNSSKIISGSSEGRNYVSNSDFHFISNSLDPKIIKLNTKNDEYEIIFEGESYGMWIHQLAIKDDNLYFTYSYPNKKSDVIQHLFKLNYKTKNLEKIPFKTKINQSYSGVESVGPDGSIWFWQGYPISYYWLKDGLLSKREITIDNKSYLVSSWDMYKDKIIYNLFDNYNNLYKLDKDSNVFINKKSIFSDLIRVDFHNSKNRLKDFYISIKDNFIYLRSGDVFNKIGKFDIGQLKLIYNNSSKSFQGSVICFENKLLGDLQILNINEKEIIFWLNGSKTYGTYNFEKQDYILNSIDVDNLTYSNITSLVSDFDGNIFGGGYLTSSDMFYYNPNNNLTKKLSYAIKYSQGQVNSLYLGRDSIIYGTVYPHAKLFSYDPKKEWNPGFKSSSNPINYREFTLGNNQMRSYNMALDYSNNIVMESVSDYSSPKHHTLSNYNFDKKTFKSINNIYDNFPIVKDLIPFDKQNNLIIGLRNGKKSFFKISNKDFLIKNELEIANTNSFLINSSDDFKTKKSFLLNDNKLYLVDKDLNLEFIFKFNLEILKSIKGENEKTLFFISKYIIYKYDLEKNKMERFFSISPQRLKGFSKSSWLAITYNNSNKLIYFAYDDELWSFNPN